MRTLLLLVIALACLPASAQTLDNIRKQGIANVGGFMEYFVLQNTRLNLVMKMADIISQSLLVAIRKTRCPVIPFAMPD